MAVKPIVMDLEYENGEGDEFRLYGADVTHVFLKAFRDGDDFAARVATECAGGADEAMEDAVEGDPAFADDDDRPQRWSFACVDLPEALTMSLGLAEVPEDVAGLFDRWAAAARASGIEDAVRSAARTRCLDHLETAIAREGLDGDVEVLLAVARHLVAKKGGAAAVAKALAEGGPDPIESISAIRSIAA